MALAQNREIEHTHVHSPWLFNTVTPYFFVHDADRFVNFLVNSFGGTEVLRTVLLDGRIANAQVHIGSSTIMASEAGGAYPPMPTACYLYMEDAEQSVQRALAASGVLEMEVADIPYGDRQGGIRDPHGNIWWISQRLVQAPYST